MAVAQLRIVIPVDSKMPQQLKAAMEDEFEIATRKWDTYPTAEERNNIFLHAMNQLRARVNSVTASPWTVENENLVLAMAGPKGELIFGTPEYEAKDFMFIRAREGWIVDQDRDPDSIKAAELPAAVFDSIIRWARTAVFYGVGSCKV